MSTVQSNNLQKRRGADKLADFSLSLFFITYTFSFHRYNEAIFEIRC